MSDESGYGGSAGVGAGEPRALAAGRGWSWIAAGYKDHFRKDLGAWIVTGVLMLVIFGVAAMIPGVNLLMNILGPIFLGGLMLGCDAQRRGEHFEVAHLLRGFSAHVGALALVGVIYTLGFIVIVMGVMFSVLGSAGAMANGGGDPMQVLLAALIAMALVVPLVMAYWFAPALVVLEGRGALEAMKRSFFGCLRNVVPFLVYGFVMMVLVIVAAIPLGLGFLIVMPVIFASIYVAWADIFGGAEQA